MPLKHNLKVWDVSHGNAPQVRVGNPNPYEPEYFSAVLYAWKLFKEKNEQYGDAFQRTGVLGAGVTLTGDVARLEQMILRGDIEGNSAAIRDKAIDAINYCVMIVMLLDGNNYRGENPRKVSKDE